MHEDNSHQTLKNLVEEFQNRISVFDPGILRIQDFLPIPGKIMVAIGMRRTGKTHFLMQVIKDLLEKKIDIRQILYINFEDDRLYPLSQEKLRRLLDDFYSLYPENHHKECYLFLDEIQNAENWPLVVRRFFETKKVKIFLSGSSSKLLSKEIATSLRGRSFAVEIWPFSFMEYLQVKKESVSELLGAVSLDKFKKYLSIFLENGGFPEIINLEQQKYSNMPEYNSSGFYAGSNSVQIGIRRQILQDYVSVVTLRDIVERYGLTNPQPLHYMINMLLKNTACSLSVQKIYNDLKSQGYSIGKDHVHEYLSHIEDTYLINSVSIHSESIRKVHSNPRKFYSVDTGLAYAYKIGFANNIGHYFENLVYLDLRRAGHKINYYLTENRKEVDFISQDRQGAWHLWQVCWDINDPLTVNREMSALEIAQNELKITGQLITPDIYLSQFLPAIAASA